MPELPEVEVVRRGLAAHVVGRTISAVEVLHPRAIRRHLPGASDFAGRLLGCRLTAARRRGKYLWLDLDDGGEPAGLPGASAILMHLGMSGQLLAQPVGKPDEKHLRIRLSFTDGDTELRFVDQRTFGGMVLTELVPSVAGQQISVPEPVGHIAADPLEAGYDVDAVVEAIRTRRTGIKRALLDQTVIAGIGNIYADEALWRASLHWARPTATLPRADAARVLAAAAEVMAEALAKGGTSFDALYVNVNGESGYFDRSLAVYGQEGRPCQRCGSEIRRDAFMNRSAYSCPTCQPLPPDAHA